MLSIIILSFNNDFCQHEAKPDSIVRIYPYVFRLNPLNSSFIYYHPKIDSLSGSSNFENSINSYRDKIIRENLDWGINGISTEKEDELISEIRKYLGISKDLFALILALLHIIKYY